MRVTLAQFKALAKPKPVGRPFKLKTSEAELQTLLAFHKGAGELDPGTPGEGEVGHG